MPVSEDLVGGVLVAGFVVFMTGALDDRRDVRDPGRHRGVRHAPDTRNGTVLAIMAGAGYALGAVCWLVSLAFRLTVGPEEFAALDAWAGALYVLHMIASYPAFAVMGLAVLASGNLPAWLGWLGLVSGLGFLLGFVATRFAGPFNPPLFAHLYPAVLGVGLLVA